jgi:hypothetical protein
LVIELHHVVQAVIKVQLVAHENTHIHHVTAQAGKIFVAFPYIFKVLKNLLFVDNVVYHQLVALLNICTSLIIILLAALEALEIESQCVLLL